MAINFTNKYMQVFQNYNEFGEHSADYVRGEDHIAFLIEENEVIYWLYLEQVWRPLNVRTTTTGQLEDGRTKVAVRLEYIEGGQKYTSVPNIPDPERITSMSHFLEYYPDIEEVNVSGTVNLTDLSYAFAGSKIKDFSKLDTSNVRYAYNLLQNVNDESLIVNFSSADSCYANYIVDGAILNEFNWIEGYGDTNARLDEHIVKGIAYKACKINKFNIPHLFNNYDNTFIEALSITVYTNNIITELIAPYIKIVVYNENLIPKDVKLSSIKGQYVLFNLSNSNNKNVVLKGNDLYIEAEDIEFKYNSNVSNENGKIILKNYCTPKHSLIVNNNYAHPRFNFGGGIKIENDKEIVLGDNLIKNKTSIGNFIFTTPIVDDAFYAKYNHPISIFQYKTTFTEVADVKITEATDSSLIYIDWGSIDFDTSNMSIEIYNKIDLLPNSSFTKHFKKLVIDNYNIESNIDGLYFLPTADDGYISGTYNSNSGNNIKHLPLFKNIRFNSCNAYMNTENLPTVLTDNNITFDNPSVIINLTAHASNFYEYDCHNLVVNGVLKAPLDVNMQTGNSQYYVVKYEEGVKIEIDLNGGLLGCYASFYYYYLKNSTIDNPVKFTNGDKDAGRYIKWNISVNYSGHPQYNEGLTNVYVETDDNTYIYGIVEGAYNNSTLIASNYSKVRNVYGSVNLLLSNYASGFIYYTTDKTLNHIDINKVITRYTSNEIICYNNVDDETTINLITKLVDNTNKNKATIYMYRSQANIIGEENIAAAVAKNYEFAIIEN